MIASRLVRTDAGGDYVRFEGRRWDITWYPDADPQRLSVDLSDWSEPGTLEVLTYSPSPEYQRIPLGIAKVGARWLKRGRR